MSGSGSDAGKGYAQKLRFQQVQSQELHFRQEMVGSRLELTKH